MVIDIDLHRLFFKFTLVSLCWIIPIFASIIDWVAAIKQAKRVGKPLRSDGMRRTISKVVSYYSMLAFALFADMIFSMVWIYENISWLEIPFITMIGTLMIIWTEWKSVREHQSEGFQKQIRKSGSEMLEALTQILSRREDIESVIQYIDKKNREDAETKNKDNENTDI